MKKTFLALAAALLAGISMPASAQSADASSPLDFKLVNKTGMILYELHVGLSSSDDWGDDLLPKDVIGNGESVNIHFSRVTGNTECAWDILVTEDLEGNSSAMVMGVDLCDVSKVTLKMEGGKMVYTTE